MHINWNKLFNPFVTIVLLKGRLYFSRLRENRETLLNIQNCLKDYKAVCLRKTGFSSALCVELVVAEKRLLRILLFEKWQKQEN